MSEPLEKLVCGALLDVLKSLSNFDEVYLSFIIFLILLIIPLSNALNILSAPCTIAPPLHYRTIW